jgi:ABC-type uncharacterized transport system auxiliary subunit
MKTLHPIWPGATVFICLLLSACMFTPVPPEAIYYYTLDYQVEPLDKGPGLPFVIRVDRFSVSPPFDSQRIIYADQGLHRNAYALHHWISVPGELMAFLLARDLSSTNRFQAVLTPDATLQATHIINGWIEEFMEEDAPEAWQASLCLHITLLAAENRDPSRRIMYQKTYRAKAASRFKTPASLAEAMSAATAQVFGSVIKDVYHSLEVAHGDLQGTTP